MISVASVLIVLVLSGCGKIGPPLPPLNRMPAAPADMIAVRRGDRVDVQFTVPQANTDNSKPADIERVDVYAFTGPASISDADLLKYGARVASIDVKKPRDPDEAVQPGEEGSEDQPEPPEGKGLDQGARARFDEPLTEATLTPASTGEGAHTRSATPLLSPSLAPIVRTYVSVGVSTRGRRGALSKRASVPLLSPPPAPPQPTIEYTPSEVTITWGAARAVTPSTATADRDVLPAKAIGSNGPARVYNVYLETPATANQPATETRLTPAPVTSTSFVDKTAALGSERCYVVRAVETIGDLSVEGAGSPPACRQLADIFAPEPPKGLKAVATEGAISLIWDPSPEKDLAGYIILRGAPGEKLAPVTPAPVTDTTYRDVVQAGVRYAYAVAAVDKSGNRSAPSNTVEETAR